MSSFTSSLTIYLPDKSEQRAFAERLERFAKAIADAEASISSMKEGIVRRTGVDYSIIGELDRARRGARGPTKRCWTASLTPSAKRRVDRTAGDGTPDDDG